MDGHVHGSACSPIARETLRDAFRRWVERLSDAAHTPMWVSRRQWLADVARWIRDTKKFSKSMAKRTLMAIAEELASYADHRSGRGAAPTRNRIAWAVGVDPRTVTTGLALLREAGYAVEVRRGHGSSGTHPQGRRPSVYNLVSIKAAQGDDFHLPRSGSVSSSSFVVEVVKNSKKRGVWKSYPEPIERMARELAPLCAGFQGREGTVCAAIARSGLDTSVWTARAVKKALDAEGMVWETPKNGFAYLLFRLRRLPAAPAADQTPTPPKFVREEKTPASSSHRASMMEMIRRALA